MAVNRELKIPVGVEQFVRDAARVEGLQVVREHEVACPVRAEWNATVGRITKLELRLSSLIAFTIGSGLLGGTIGAALIKAMLAQ